MSDLHWKKEAAAAAAVGDQSHYCAVYFYKELENVGGAPRGDVPTTSRPGSLIEAGENFFL